MWKLLLNYEKCQDITLTIDQAIKSELKSNHPDYISFTERLSVAHNTIENIIFTAVVSHF